MSYFIDQPSTFGGCGGCFVEGLSIILGIVIVLFLVFCLEGSQIEVQQIEQVPPEVVIEDTSRVEEYFGVLKYGCVLEEEKDR